MYNFALNRHVTKAELLGQSHAEGVRRTAENYNKATLALQTMRKSVGKKAEKKA